MSSLPALPSLASFNYLPLFSCRSTAKKGSVHAAASGVRGFVKRKGGGRTLNRKACRLIIPWPHTHNYLLQRCFPSFSVNKA